MACKTHSPLKGTDNKDFIVRGLDVNWSFEGPGNGGGGSLTVEEGFRVCRRCGCIYLEGAQQLHVDITKAMKNRIKYES